MLHGRCLIMRDHRGRYLPHPDPLTRFLNYCRFDPMTGCVLWVGGRTRGKGHTGWYGCFKYKGKSWKAHRWAAKFILGLRVDDLVQVDHCCPHGPNTLCVRHLQSVTPEVNRELQWVRVQVGLDPEPDPVERTDAGIPFYEAPEWARGLEVITSCTSTQTIQTAPF